ncbi:type IV pilus assembly protein PilM [Caldanaerobacter sp.]|uniref:type IV pilus assembly protein PilM n=1 Tax=Caldanaerobacter sp. TaxID=2930036 RepID=UPI003C771181
MLGIEIGNANIKIVLKDRKNKLLGSTYLVKTPSNVITDGKIMDINTVAEAIREVLRENNIREKRVCFSISSSQNILREITLPKMKEEEVEKALEYEIEQYIPDTYNYVIDFKFLPPLEGNGEKLRVLVASSPKEIVEKYVKLSEALKLYLEAIDIYANSLYKAFKKIGEKDGTVAIIDFGSSITNVTIISHGNFVLNKLLEFGGKKLTRAIAGSFNLDFDTAEEYKETREIENIEGILRENFSEEFQMVSRIFDFFYATYHKTVDKILLIGGNAKLKGLKEYVKDYFKVEVIVPEDERYLYFLPAYGCLLRGE